MKNHVNFLRQKAAVLRGLALRAPPIAETLRRLADELEARAAELERNQDGAPSAEEP